MDRSLRRRTFLSACSLAVLGPIDRLPGWAWGLAAAAEEVPLVPEAVVFAEDLEPLVRAIEQVPAERALELAVSRLKEGTTPRQLLAAIFLAGIRNVNPQPPGFKLHCVFAVQAAHQLSLDVAPSDRLLPLLWALREFKNSQAEDARQGDFVLKKVQGELPSPEQAWREFDEAMRAWDEPRADRAMAALVRSRGAHEVMEGLWRYGARDYRNIGHKAIYVANAFRTLQVIGWRHAEPVLRSVVLGLLDFKTQEVNGYTFENQSYEANVDRIEVYGRRLPGDWTRAGAHPSATREVLEILRSGEFPRAIDRSLELLQQGTVGAGAIWDAAHLAAGELMMRQPGIYGIHTVTSLNALRYAYEMSARRRNRLLLLMQGLGWMGQFANFMGKTQAGLGPTQITDLPAADLPADSPAALQSIFETLAKEPAQAAAQAQAYARRGGDLAAFAGVAKGLVVRKQSDAHHYKYSTAVFEDLTLVSPEWRPQLLATSVYYLRGLSVPEDQPLQALRDLG
jgi:hypothetical protein